MSGSGGGLETGSPPGVFPEEYSRGFSSLLLLAGTESTRRILYLLSWPRASVALTSSGDTRTTCIGVDGWTRLPLLPQSVDVVVADFDAVPKEEETQRAVALELRRVLHNGGRCIAAVTRGRRPRDPRAWRRYRLIPPAAKWDQILRSSGLEPLEAALLRFDGERLTDLELPSHPGASRLPAGRAHAIAVVLSHASLPGPTVVEEISRRLRSDLRTENDIERVFVRKLGKTAAFLSTGRSRVVVRMPSSPLAVARMTRNHRALQALHRPAVENLGSLVPQPLGCGQVGSQAYFVESCMPGSPREARVARLSWEPQAIEFITSLHLTTARRQTCADPWFQQSIEPALRNIERSNIDGGQRAAIGWLRSWLRERLIGQELPLVRSHGDFTGSNCLYEPEGSLSGVVDWELSGEDTLPLLDLMQCFDLPAEYTSDGRWHRADLVFDAVDGRGPLADTPAIENYIERLRLPREVVPALLLLHWVEHAGARVLARQSDDRWFAHRVDAPLARLRELARTRSAQP